MNSEYPPWVSTQGANQGILVTVGCSPPASSRSTCLKPGVSWVLFHFPANFVPCYMPRNSIIHGGTWSNRTYVAPAQFSLLATCEVFWSHRRRDIGYTAIIFLPERMYITLDSSACTSYPSLKRHKCLWQFGKATGLHELSSFLLSQ